MHLYRTPRFTIATIGQPTFVSYTLKDYFTALLVFSYSNCLTFNIERKGSAGDFISTIRVESSRRIRSEECFSSGGPLETVRVNYSVTGSVFVVLDEGFYRRFTVGLLR